LVVEGRVDDALRRAKAEGKLVLVHVIVPTADEARRRAARLRLTTEGRELLLSRFVAAEVTWDEAETLRKPTDDTTAGMFVILKPDGLEQDRLRDLGGKEW